jgi:hypothetical protein
MRDGVVAAAFLLGVAGNGAGPRPWITGQLVAHPVPPTKADARQSGDHAAPCGRYGGLVHMRGWVPNPFLVTFDSL